MIDAHRARLIECMERQGINTPKYRPAKSYIAAGTNPKNGWHFEQRVNGTPTDVIVWAKSEGLMGSDFRIHPDIYDPSYSRNW